ncbi:MAG: orotate phosphoribosyltransferase [Bacteroidales bacterium]|nr:orotate phosphoribosyltransferase [Bacteroidales bacterium]
MIYKEEIANKMAELLLKVKAVKINVKEPFTWASGLKSPIYCDNRITLSYPAIRTFIRQQLSNIVKDEFGNVDVIAGVATGGIPHGVLVAQDLGLPFAYVRTSKKEHGLTNQIEGVIESGQSVVMIEDLISTGGSSLDAVKAVKQKGAVVKGLLAIFSYGFYVADEKFQEADSKMITLTDYDFLINNALENNYIRESEIDTLKKWREAPEKWLSNGKE